MYLWRGGGAALKAFFHSGVVEACLVTMDDVTAMSYCDNSTF